MGEDSEENMKMGLEESEEIEEEKPKKICTGRGVTFICYTPKPPKKELTQEEPARRLRKGKKKNPTTSKKTEEKPKKICTGRGITFRCYTPKHKKRKENQKKICTGRGITFRCYTPKH